MMLLETKICKILSNIMVQPYELQTCRFFNNVNKILNNVNKILDKFERASYLGFVLEDGA